MRSLVSLISPISLHVWLAVVLLGRLAFPFHRIRLGIAYEPLQSALAVQTFNEESLLMLAPQETNERMEIRHKSYRHVRVTRDLT